MFSDGKEYFAIGEFGHEIAFRFDLIELKYIFRRLRRGTIKKTIGRELTKKELPVEKPKI